MTGCLIKLHFPNEVQHSKITNLQKRLLDVILYQNWTLFLLAGYIFMDFVFVLMDFIKFSRFYKYAVNDSTFDSNWFTCFFKVLALLVLLTLSTLLAFFFCVLISSSFSNTRRSTWVLYLVQDWKMYFQYNLQPK